ncbi:hypothetical protein Tco_1054286 [Tanacetum coccineum]|uniref:Uncharacterized protein n=1 Tax=Tanacetum coccineum TaxID=301880 RepID=A0ABQ5GWR9_9ASTR
MTNKIDTVLKAITNQIVGTLPSDTIKNPKLETHPVSFAQPDLSLDEEFKDLHLNLPVIEVLAYASIYSAILDKYVESLELGRNGSAFVQGEVPEKIGDPELFTLPWSETPLLVGRGFLATASVVIDCRMAKIAVGKWITRSIFRVKGINLGAKHPYYARKDFLDRHLPGEWEISKDVEHNPFKDTLVFRRMVEFPGAIPINLKCNMWESEDLVENKIDWNKPPKNGDVAWHVNIRIIDPDEEEFTKTLQSIPTTRKLSERENPKEIINLDHFYDTWHLDDLHVTWAHLEKKRMRLRNNTKILEDISLQTLEMASEALHHAVAAYQATASQDF